MPSTSSAVTYTSVYTDSEPGRVYWGADEELSEKGERLAKCMAPTALPSPPLPPPLHMLPPVDRRDDILKTEMPPCKRLCLSTIGSRHRWQTLRVMGDIRREMGDMQAKLLALRGQPMRAGQPGGDARVPNHLDAPRDADKRQSNNKRKADELFRNSHGYQQQTPKRQNVARVYNMETGEKKPYSGNLPKSFGNSNVVNAQRNNEANPKGNGCFECGATWHFKRDYQKLKNKDEEKGNAPGWVYAVGNAEKRGNASRDPNSNVIMGHPFNVDLMPVELDTATVARYSYSDTAPETLRVIRDMRQEMGDMQAELLALREQSRRARQPRSDARVPDHHDAPRDTDIHI
nr:hypothetical protein [Tanacetum cinerariifolium]